MCRSTIDDHSQPRRRQISSGSRLCRPSCASLMPSLAGWQLRHCVTAMEVWLKIFFKAQRGGFGPHEGWAGLQMHPVKTLYSAVERCVMVAKRGRTDCVRRGPDRMGGRWASQGWFNCQCRLCCPRPKQSFGPVSNNGQLLERPSVLAQRLCANTRAKRARAMDPRWGREVWNVAANDALHPSFQVIPAIMFWPGGRSCGRQEVVL